MPVQLSREGRVAIVVMDRPDARNAMNMEMTEQLDATYDELAHDEAIWVVVLTGAGDRAFCAGQDLKEAGLAGRRRSAGGFGGITRRDFGKPLIAAVNGFALGGGFEICLACDLVIAEEHATLGLPEVKRGIFAGGGGLVRLGKRIPMALALEMAMTGEPVSAQRALELGLVNRVVPRGQSVRAAVELANVICEAAPLSVRLSKRVIRASLAQGEDELYALQAQLGAELYQTEDAREGPRAFVEKRAPRWQGR
ncbi:MAG: crotonase/enoyl-CoA hydratase family protein [Chloroflexi bacterium]|nr:crotonase/enoyl-CoA hydratase family protein [Chloroflexota bacterium]